MSPLKCILPPNLVTGLHESNHWSQLSDLIILIATTNSLPKIVFLQKQLLQQHHMKK